MATKEEIYSIRVGRHFLQQVSLGQLKMIQNLIHDFFTKEDWIPLAAAATNPNILSPNMIFIAKDTCFDSRNRDFQTEYSVHIGKDALTNISAKGKILSFVVNLTEASVRSGSCAYDCTILPSIYQQKLCSQMFTGRCPARCFGMYMTKS